MLDVWVARPSYPKCLTSTHRETLFASVNLSLLRFAQDIKVQITPVLKQI
jgi:hypothetical protein